MHPLVLNNLLNEFSKKKIIIIATDDQLLLLSLEMRQYKKNKQQGTNQDPVHGRVPFLIRLATAVMLCTNSFGEAFWTLN